MDEIFIAIMEQIAQEMLELSLIDEDYGQLEMGAEEDQYPVTFPCVLIGNTNSDWHDIGYGAQKSESALTVRLAIDCYDDTSLSLIHISSNTFVFMKARKPMCSSFRGTPVPVILSSICMTVKTQPK